MSSQTIENRYPRSSFFYAMDNCEAAFSLSQASGEEPTSPFSERGTEIHAWLAAPQGHKPELDPDAIETARDLEAQEYALFESWHEDDVVDSHREERLWLRDGLIPIYSGKPDVWYVSQDMRVLLPDYKTGWHPLDHYVATNCQLRSYVPLIDEELENKVTSITVAILKPGKKFPPALFEREEIEDAREWSVQVARRATAEGEKVPNRGEWCKYCSGKVLCPLWKTEIEEMSALVTARLSDIPDRALNELAPRLAVARTVIERLEARLYARARAFPDHFPDWRFEKGDWRRSVEPENLRKIFDVLVTKKADLTFSQFLDCCRVSLGDLEKQVRLNRKETTRDIVLYLEKQIGELVEKRRNKDKLVYDPQIHETHEQAETQTESQRALPGGENGDEQDGTGTPEEGGNLEPGEIA